MKTVHMVLAMIFVLMAPLIASADDATVTDLVDKAIDLWKEKGRDYALKVINASAGPLKKGSMYTFAVDFRGVVLAHPVQKAFRGQDLWELQDVNGKFLTQEFIKAAKSQEGLGWVEYDWIRVQETEPTRKRTFVKRIPGEDVLVASGYYTHKSGMSRPPTPGTLNPSLFAWSSQSTLSVN